MLKMDFPVRENEKDRKELNKQEKSNREKKMKTGNRFT